MKTVKNVAVVLLVLLTLDCHCMFLGIVQNVITKLPFARFLIAAMVKQSGQKQGIVSLKKIGLGAGGLLTAALINKKQAKAEHVLYRQGENDTIVSLDENEYKKIDEIIVQKHQWPSAIKNPEYNPDVDETKVIQEKLDQQFPGVKAMWVPDTLFDIADYETCVQNTPWGDLHKYPVAQGAKYFVNNTIIKEFKTLKQNEILTNQEKTTLFKMLAKQFSQSIHQRYYESLPKEIIDNAIDLEMEYKINHPAKTLFFRGYRKGVDFNEEDSFDIAKKQSESNYSKALAGERERFNKINRVNMIYDGAVPLSYGQRLLDNVRTINQGECPLRFIRTDNRGFAMPVEKRELMNRSNKYFSLGGDLEEGQRTSKLRPIFKSGRHFHPRAKAHVSEERPDILIQRQTYFDRSDPRVAIHKTQPEARQGYADYFEYTLYNAIPLTESTANELKKAKEAWDRGVAERKFDQLMLQWSQRGDFLSQI